MDTARLCAAGLCVTLVLVLLRSWNPSFELPMKLSAAILFVGLLLGLARPLISYVSSLLSSSAAAPYAEILLRALGVAILTETVSGICRECKETSVASYLEIAGRLEILILCLPLMEEILESVKGLLSL
ncbi:MAG: stage III sporulation AC/AD family protein [Clostridia bacterium]|nr:stage III sporulation AC/AD family protein [Clostridia bacterium]